MAWRPAPSVAAGLAEATRRWPHRSRASDGTIGDAAHAARQSDHNPDARGVVHAFDLTHDPAHGVDCEQLASHLVRVRDARVKYLIWNKRICSSTHWAWQPYTGKNPHTHHLHVSIRNTTAAELDTSPWWDMNEKHCAQRHFTIDEAIAHAKRDLAVPIPNPVWGTRGGQIANVGWVIGYESEDRRRRIRLDYDPNKGVHVNEEDFSKPLGQQKVVHVVELPMTPMNDAAERAWRRAAEGWMQIYWVKWTSRYDKPQRVLDAEGEVDRRGR